VEADTITERLAQFVMETSTNSLSDEVLRRAIDGVIDTVGVRWRARGSRNSASCWTGSAPAVRCRR